MPNNLNGHYSENLNRDQLNRKRLIQAWYSAKVHEEFLISCISDLAIWLEILFSTWKGNEGRRKIGKEEEREGDRSVLESILKGNVEKLYWSWLTPLLKCDLENSPYDACIMFFLSKQNDERNMIEMEVHVSYCNIAINVK